MLRIGRTTASPQDWITAIEKIAPRDSAPLQETTTPAPKIVDGEIELFANSDYAELRAETIRWRAMAETAGFQTRGLLAIGDELNNLRATLATQARTLDALAKERDTYKELAEKAQPLIKQGVAENLRLRLALDALREAATHAVNEIEGQLSANSALYWKRSSTRIYWRQVVGVLRAALTTEPTP
jgi:hypothetical protein